MKEAGVRKLQGKHCLVLGLAKSGRSVAKLLSRLGAKVTLNEKKHEAECENLDELKRLGIRIVCGGHPPELLTEDIDLIVRNPGIPYDIPFLLEAEKRQIPIVTEVEIAYLISEAPIIGVTGSNGKTTTTTLICDMLNGGERTPLIAGNIGTVFCDVAAKATKDEWIVAELSSFQLLGTQTFCPEIGVLLNVFDAHLDYHHTKEHYIGAKANMFVNQDENQLGVYHFDMRETREVAGRMRSQKAWFSSREEVPRGTYIADGAIIYKEKTGRRTWIIDVQDIKLPGEHNLENMLAAVTVSMEAGAHLERVREVLRRFEGVAHRLQFVREVNGIKFYNDSKATNVLATQRGLQSFPGSVVLIAGGLDRGNAYDELIPIFSSHVKALIAYGQTAPKLIRTAEKAGVKRIVRVDNVKEAVRSAYHNASAGDIVLLSPAAASWDQFRSFEERGDMFVSCVHMLR